MIEVSVYKCMADWNANKRCLCQRVELNDSISFPFDEIRKSLKVLFGSASVIEITLM